MCKFSAIKPISTVFKKTLKYAFLFHEKLNFVILGLNNSRDFKLLSGSIVRTPVHKLQFNPQVFQGVFYKNSWEVSRSHDLRLILKGL